MSELSPVKRALRRIEELEEQIARPRAFEPVAIVAMGCRLPGGVRSPKDFWKLLSEGNDAVIDVPAGRWTLDRYFDANPDAPGKHVNRQGGFLTDRIDEFDAGLFGISPVEAKALDPQHRLLLETSWEAWENAGIPIDSLRGSETGVWIGISASDYTQGHLHSGDATRIGPYDVTGSIGSTAAGRLSYFYDLRGPGIAVDTACSSSLVAIDLACAALRDRTCKMALAGGVSLMLSPEANICFSKMQALSPDGRSKAFDAAADGFGRGEGCGILILQRLEDAQRAGHPVLAVIRSTAVNQDGRSNGLTAPSVDGQVLLLRAALERAGLRAGDIGYLEAHGTGTPLGDPIELEAVAEVLAQGRTSPLWIGSVKTNIGHLEAAAGVAGVIKAVLAMQHQKFPAHLHFREPSSYVPWEELAIRVPVELTDWQGPVRSGVSSFGFSGTNAHIILEQPPEISEAPLQGETGPSLLCLSGRDAASLGRVVASARDFCETNPNLPFEQICRAYRTQRQHLNERAAFCGTSLADANSIRGKFQDRPRLVFAFTGQGSQYAGMGRQLYESEPVFRQAFDRCLELCDRQGRVRLALFGNETGGVGGSQLDETELTQPAVFAIGFALSELLRSWGIHPEAVMGHSVGEYTAAVVAGVFSLDDGCRLVAARGALMQALPRNGSMAAIFIDAPSVAKSLLRFDGKVEIAAWNGPSNVVISGGSESLSDVLDEFAARGVRYKRLAVSHAFHSHLMDPMLADYRKQVSACQRLAPRIPLYSNLTGSAEADYTAVEYWVEHARRPVRFVESVRSAARPNVLFIEIGPHPVLSALGGEIVSTSEWIPTLRKGLPDRQQLLQTAGNLYVRGVNLEWAAMGRPATHITLPNYPFERNRFWMDRPGAVAVSDRVEEVPRRRTETGAHFGRTEILNGLREILRDSAGFENVDQGANLLDLGIDSLMLMTMRQRIIERYGVEIAVSQFFGELSSIEKIATHVEGHTHALPDSEAVERTAIPQLESSSGKAPAGVENLVAQQIQTMSDLIARQLEALKGTASASPKAAQGEGIPLPASSGQVLTNSSVMPETFVPYKPIHAEDDPSIDDRRKGHLLALSKRVEQVTSTSKELVERYRPVFANNRHIAGFRPAWKEMVYQLSMESASGSHFRAAGGRDFIDMTMGFGVHLFGHKAPFIQEALHKELDSGSGLGPVSDMAGLVAEKFCRITGMERVAFYNTGSEAVMTALRIARTATQRSRIAIFEGSYHGTFDGVLALRREKDGMLFTEPGSPGTPAGMIQDVMVLRYDDLQSLELIERYGSELAAVLTEPVQSRRPDIRPKKFLDELRRITKQSGTALIFDEIVSGFRCQPGGAQEYFGIRADLATYGKVIGGGMPIGLVAGAAEYMDAVDGGQWRFGDASYPRKRNTFVAGTFCHHPLALAAISAVLDKMTEEGPGLQENLNRRTAAFCDRLNTWFTANEVPIRVAHFASLLRFFLRGDLELLFYHLIARGIYVWEGRNCFLSTAHTDEDLDRVAKAVFESVEELRSGGFLPSKRGIAIDHVVPPTPAHANPARPALEKAVEFSLFYFSSAGNADGEGYRLMIEGAKYADENGFTAVWTPERHFHEFGGLYPNPAITSAALAGVTKRIRLRAGSVVALLHDPVRFAENWAMVDRLSGGRVDLALALGWNSNDFVFAPEQFEQRSRLLPEYLSTVRNLWQGGTVNRTGGKGEEVEVRSYPRPVQPEIPMWFTAAGNPETFQMAGQHGANVLTYLEGQSFQDLTAKIKLYRESRQSHGNAGRGHVTLMLHTFLGTDTGEVLRRVDKPLREYLKSSLYLRTQFLNSVGAHLDALSEKDLKPILDRAVDRYIGTCSLIGTPESCLETVRAAAAAGVDEIACLIDFGVPFDEAMRGLVSLKTLKDTVANSLQPDQPSRDNNQQECVPLTQEQRQLWYLARQGREASVAYNEMVLLRLSGSFSLQTLQGALNVLVARHEALRTEHIGENGQRFAERVDVLVDNVDFRGVPGERRDAEIAAKLSVEAAREFDFENGPLFRVVVLTTAPDEHRLLLTVHHLVANGWSISLALEELAAIYSAMRSGRETKLTAALPFSRYLEWERRQTETATKDQEYWASELDAPLPDCELPTTNPRGPAATWRGARRSLNVGGSQLRSLRATARQNGTTLFMVLLGGWATVIGRLSGARRVAVWTPVARQAAMGAQSLVGQCTRMFPVIVEIDDATTGATLLRQIKGKLLDLYAHQNRSLSEMQGLTLPPALTMFNLDRAPGLPKFEGVTASIETPPIASAKYELSLNILEIGGRLVLDAEYREDLFDDRTIESWLSCYEKILQSLTEDTNQPLRKINLGGVPGPEINTEPAPISVIEAFERQAERGGSRVALRFGHREVTFGQLNHDAGRMAASLAAKGIQPGDGVGLDPDDPLDAMTARLAIMKLRAHCIEPDRSSILAMLNWCDRSALILSRGAAARAMQLANVLDLDDLKNDLKNQNDYQDVAAAEANELAFVFVLAEESFACSNAMLAAQATAACELFDLRENDRVVVYGRPGMETLFGALTAGATVTFGDDRLLNTAGIESAEVAVLPAHLDRHPSLRKTNARLIVFTDCPISAAGHAGLRDAQAFLEICRPEGIPLLAAVGDCNEAGRDRRGVLCRSMYLPGYAIDTEGSPAIEGQTGRWRLSGARGACTTETRVQVRSGRVLWMTGRDREVETALRSFVQDAAVFPVGLPGSSETRLVAWVVPFANFGIASVRNGLAGTVPPELIPDTFAELPFIPETARQNPRELDQLAGPAQTGRALSGPRNEQEAMMCALWEEILERYPIGINDAFTDLGGQSLDAARLIARIHQVFHRRASFADLLAAGTPAKLCRVLYASEAGGSADLEDIPAITTQQDYELSRAQHRMWAMSQASPESVGYHVPVGILLEGPLEVEALESALHQLTSRHESLRTAFVQRLGEPRQVIHEETGELEVIQSNSVKIEETVLRMAKELALMPFELSRAPLWRARLIRFASDRHALVLTFHHIITDGWSIEVCSRDLGTLYQARKNRLAALAPLPIQYKDFAVWENARAMADSAGLNWWVNRLTGAQRIELPRDLPSGDGLDVATLRVPFGEELARELDSFCRTHGATRFMGIAAATVLLLNRLSRATDVCLGTPVAQREHPSLQDQAGLFVNTVVLRQRVSEQETFASLVGSIRETCLEAMAHAGVPFDLVAEKLDGDRQRQRSPLFDFMVTLEESPRVLRNWGELRIKPIAIPPVASLFDLNFRFQACATEMVLSLDYRAGVFESGRIELWANRFLKLLHQALENPQAEIATLDMRSDVEKQARKRRVRAEIHL